MKGDTSEDETDDHAGGRPEHDLAAANDVDILERKEREDEVRARDDESDGGRLVEPYLLKQCR